MKPAQAAGTEVALNWIGQTMHQTGGPMLVVVPTVEVRDRWILQRLNPMLRETPVLAELFDSRVSRSATNSKDIKDYPGGILVLSGANSPASLRSMPIQHVICDEVDAFPWEVGREGDPLGLIEARTSNFPRRKILLISTPTVEGASRIKAEYDDSDRRHYHVPCPHCGEKQVLRRANLSWDPKFRKVWYTCEHNGCVIEEHHKPAMLAAGEWIPEEPGNPVRGYNWNALYAPIGLGFSWEEHARAWVSVQGDRTQLKRYINTVLAETWEDRTHKLTPHELAKRAEDVPQGSIPPGVLALTCGVDTQDQWLSATLLGWGRGNRFRIIEHVDLHGDTTKESTWDQLQDYLHAPRANAWGHPMRIRATGVDMRGHRGAEVRRFCGRRQLRVPVYACIGSTTRLRREIKQTPGYAEKSPTGKTIRGGVAHWEVGTEECKDFIYGNLASDGNVAPEERTFRFPADLLDEYFYGLMSEVFDPAKNRYIRRLGAKYKRNEPLDTLVLAYAIGHHAYVKIGRDGRGRPNERYWDRLEVLLEPPETTPAPTEPQRGEPVVKTPSRPTLPRRIGGIRR